MKKAKKIFNRAIVLSIINSALFIAIGAFLILKTTLTTKTIGYIVGSILLIAGISSIIKFLTSRKVVIISGYELALGILGLLLGLFILFNPFVLTSVLTLGFGIYLVINGALKLSHALVLKEIKKEGWLITTCIAMMIMAVGLIILIDPFTSSKTIAEIFGLFMIIYGILDVLEILIIKKYADDFMRKSKRVTSKKD